MPTRLLTALLVLAVVAAACSGSTEPDETLPGGVTTVADGEAPPVAEPPTTTAPPITGPLAADISTEDGLVLESRTFPAGRDWVVLAHMRPADMTSWFDFGERLAAEGYTALTFNFRGYGNSEGGPDEFAVGTDVTAAVDFAVGRGAERVFVIGASMGGTGALVAAADRPVAGVATLSAPGDFFGADALAAVPRITAPKLFVAAESDAPYPDIVAEFVEVAPDSARQQIFTGNAHGTDLFTSHGPELTDLLLDFLAGA